MPTTLTSAVNNKRLVRPGMRTSFEIEEFNRATPDFHGFAAKHPWIGQKVGKIQSLPGGFAQQYQAATLYGVFGGDPFEVHGPIRDKYDHLKGPLGILGFPTTNQTPTADGKGGFNHFQKGSIYWHPSTGAFEVHGEIRQKWLSLGAESFGYPITDDSTTLDGIGRFNHFRTFHPDGTVTERSIFWTPITGANDVRDAIRTKWSNENWENGFLGYPVSGEYTDGLGRRSDFTAGSIAWTAEHGAQVQPQRLVVNGPNITFEDGIPVGGYGQLVVFSDGVTHFFGHLHNSGMPPFDCLVVFTIKDSEGRAYAASASGTAHGWDPGSRNLDWDIWGKNDEVRANWSKIWSHSIGGYHVEVTSDWTTERVAEFVGKIAGAAAAVIGLFVGLGALGGKGSDKSSDPNYGPPESFPVGGLPPPESTVQTIS